MSLAQVISKHGGIIVALEKSQGDEFFERAFRIYNIGWKRYGIGAHDNCDAQKRWEEKLSAFILETVAEVAPEVIDCRPEKYDRFSADSYYSQWEFGALNFGYCNFWVKLDQGTFHSQVKLYSNLRHACEELDGVRGFVLPGRSHYFPDKLSIQSGAGTRWSVLRVLNFLFHEAPTLEDVLTKNEGAYPLDSDYNDKEKDNYPAVWMHVPPLLKQVREGEQSIIKFLSWVREYMPQIERIGELLAVVDKNRKCMKGVSKPVARKVKKFGRELFEEARTLYEELHPPQNERRDVINF